MYRDMNIEHTALESGLERFIKLDKADFIGQAALVKQKREGIQRRLITLHVESNEADAYMSEGVYHGDELIGRVSSGGRSHHLGRNIALAYVKNEYSSVDTALSVQVLDQRC